MASALHVAIENGIAVDHLRPPRRVGEQVLARGQGRIRRGARPAQRATRRSRGAVLISGKPDTFIAGADIEEFAAMHLGGAGRAAASSEGQAMLDRLEQRPSSGRRRDPRRLPRGRARAGARLRLARLHRPSEDPARAAGGAARADPRCGGHAAAAARRGTAGRARHDPHREERTGTQGGADRSRGRPRAPGDPARHRPPARARTRGRREATQCQRALAHHAHAPSRRQPARSLDRVAAGTRDDPEEDAAATIPRPSRRSRPWRPATTGAPTALPRKRGCSARWPRHRCRRN